MIKKFCVKSSEKKKKEEEFRYHTVKIKFKNRGRWSDKTKTVSRIFYDFMQQTRQNHRGGYCK